MKKPGLTYKTFIIALAFAFSGISAIAANRYSVASGSWHSTSTWSVTSGGIPGASVPGKNDDVYLENGHIVTVTSDEACSSITFTGSGGTLVINSPAVLTLKTSITLNKLTNSDSYCNLTGTGTLNCIEVVVGSGDNPPPADGGSSVYTHTFTSNIAYLNIAEKGNPKNNLIINSYLGSASHIRNGVFNLESGTLVVEGMIMVNNASSANNSVFSMATGTQSGTLIFGGRSTPVSLSATGINTINFNGTSSLVNYSRAGVQTVFGTPYNNLTLSGSGAKTLNEVTVNGILSVEGTATTTGTTPVYGPLSALQYKGTQAQTAGIEFPLSFNGSGGVIINNVFGINLNSSRTISSKLTFIAGRLNTGVYTLSMTSSATVSGAGAGKYVNGNFQKEIPPGTLSKTFETGDASVYAPVVLTFTGTISAGGSITVKTTAGDHPNLASSTFNSGVTVNRYWTLTNSGVSGFISYSATFNFVASDIDPGADYHHFYVGNYNAATWTYPALGTLAATSTQATGLTSFGDFQIGELPVASYRTRQSGAWNLTSTWESFNGAIWIAAISTPTLAAGYITIRSSHAVTNTVSVTVDQVIIDAGGRLNLDAAMVINDGPAYDFSVNGTLDCTAGNLTGAGSFILNSFADLIIRSPEGITLSGSTGNIQTLTRVFNPWANYSYRSSAAQVTGDGLPLTVNNLIVDNSAGVSLTSSLTTNGSLILTSGTLYAGTNTLTFLTSDTPVSRTSGTITTTPQTDLIFGSPENMTGEAFTLPDGLFAPIPVINNLTIHRINSLALNDQVLSVGGILLCNGPLITNGNLTLHSNDIRTGLIDGTSTGEISGNVTMQRYLPSGFGYRYLSSPFQSATVNEFSDDIDLGTYFPTVYRYDENRIVSGTPSSGWVSFNAPSDILNPMSGYAVNFGSSALPVTVDVAGIVNNGTVSAILYNNNHPYTKGFNLVGNPYPSPIDWDALNGWTKNNIDNSLYLFRASTSDEYGGTYSTYINGISNDGVANNIIPSMQGFFIHVTDGDYPVTGMLGMNDSVRVNDLTRSLVKSEKRDPSPVIRLTAEFSGVPGSGDPLVIYFDEKAMEGFDKNLDALKLMNTDFMVPNFYSIAPGGNKLSINALPNLNVSDYQVPLGMKTNINGTVIFKIQDISEKFTGSKLLIYDSVTGTENELGPGMEYKVSLPKGEYNGRFFLNYSNFITKVEENDASSDPFIVYFSNGVLKTEILNISGNNSRLRMFSLTGHALFDRAINAPGYYEFSPQVRDGIYIVMYSTGSVISSKKIFIKN